MKTFHYPLGHEAITTMTVAELRAALVSYPDDMPVLAEWEGVHAAFNPEDFNTKPYSAGRTDEECAALIINVDQW